MKQYALFDMDGTLLDSMQYWRGAHMEFVDSHLRLSPEDEARAAVKHMTLQQVSEWCARYGVRYTVEDYLAIMERHYRHDIGLKTGTLPLLRYLREQGVQMAIASASPTRLIQLALQTTGIDHFFSFILSTEDYPGGKGAPEIFRVGLSRFGCAAVDCALYDDALYSLRTAYKEGLYTIGVADETNVNDRDEIALCTYEFCSLDGQERE